MNKKLYEIYIIFNVENKNHIIFQYFLFKKNEISLIFNNIYD